MIGVVSKKRPAIRPVTNTSKSGVHYFLPLFFATVLTRRPRSDMRNLVLSSVSDIHIRDQGVVTATCVDLDEDVLYATTETVTPDGEVQVEVVRVGDADTVRRPRNILHICWLNCAIALLSDDVHRDSRGVGP